jgi:hypothetical protein
MGCPFFYFLIFYFCCIYSMISGLLFLFKNTFQKYGSPVCGLTLWSGRNLKNDDLSLGTSLDHLPPPISGSTCTSLKCTKHIWYVFPSFSIGTIFTSFTQSHSNNSLNTDFTFASVTNDIKCGRQNEGIDILYKLYIILMNKSISIFIISRLWIPNGFI